MTVAKKIRPKQSKTPKTHFKNECGQKNPTQAEQDTTWHLLKMTVAKKIRIKQCKLPKNTF